MKNHIFWVDSDQPTTMKTKTWIKAEEEESQDMKKISKGGQALNRFETMINTKLLPLERPGLKPIKQVELFTKWRQFVLEEYKDIICPEPPKEIRDKVKHERNQKQQQHQKSKKKKKGSGDANDEHMNIIENMECV
jgi:hypothetical protein